MAAHPKPATVEDLAVVFKVPGAERVLGFDFFFAFYPRLVGVWTALVLFMGIFLEGFFKGEKLVGEGGSE
jgi:hypothetical protein